MKKLYIFILMIVLVSQNLIAQSVCEDQLVSNNGISANSIGQSIFMSECSGSFSSIELERSDEGAEMIAELIILNGQTFLGTPRYVQTVTIPQSSGPFTINFDEGTGDLSFFEDSQYTFILTNPALQLGASSDINSYIDGQMFVDVGFINNDDLWFKLSVTSTLGQNTSEFHKISIFPNPANDYVQVSGINQAESFTIYNSLGIKVKNGIVSKDEGINIQNLSSGLYYLRLNNEKTFKFLKK